MAKHPHHTRPCEMCGTQMVACYNMSEGGACRAWYCDGCGHTSSAIGRERKFRFEDAESDGNGPGGRSNET